MKNFITPQENLDLCDIVGMALTRIHDCNTLPPPEVMEDLIRVLSAIRTYSAIRDNLSILPSGVDDIAGRTIRVRPSVSDVADKILHDLQNDN
jgi:hypothetical protein